MRHVFFVLAMVGFAAGLSIQSRGESAVAEELRLPSGQGIAALNRIANDTNRLRADRAEAIAKLFTHYVRPGHTPKDMATFLKQPAWLDGAVLTEVYGVGGVVRVLGGCGVFKQDKAFRLGLYHREGESVSWAVEFRLKGVQPGGNPPTTAQIIDFFRGSDVLCQEPALTELAVYSPDNNSPQAEKILYFSPEGNVWERLVPTDTDN